MTDMEFNDMMEAVAIIDTMYCVRGMNVTN